MNLSPSNRSALFLIIAILLSLFVGIFCVLFAGFVGDSYAKLLAPPAAICIGMVFLLDRYTFFLLIILFRSALDPILDQTKLGSFGLGAVMNALVIVIGIIVLIEKPRLTRSVFCKTWIAFLLIALPTIAIAPDKVAAIKTYLSLVSYASIFVIGVGLVESEKDFGKWMRAVFLSSVVPGLYSFINIANGGFISGNTEAEGFRLNSTFTHPNIFGFYLVLIISIGFYFIKSKVAFIPEKWRKLIPFYILFLLVLLLLSKCRSAWAASFAFFAIYGLIYERRYLVWIGVAILGALMVPEIRDRLVDLTHGNEVVNYSKLNSYAWRKLIWHDGLTWMSPGHYFLGYGLEAFKYFSVDFFSMAGGHPAGAHSVYVQLIFETGGIGVLAFIWAHFKTGLLLSKYYKVNKLLIFIAVMLLLEFATEAYADNMLVYLSYNWYLWFVLGATYGYCNVSSDSDESIELKKTE